MPRKEEQICEGITWLDITEPSNAEMEELSKTYQLNEYMVRDCLQPEHLPKYEFIDGVHFFIIRFFTTKSEGKSDTIQDLTNKIAIFSADHFFITIHRVEVPFLEKIRKRFLTSEQCSGSAELLTKIVWEALDTFYERVNRLGEQLDFHEQHIMVGKMTNTQITALYVIKREAALSQKVLLLMSAPVNHIFHKGSNDAAFQDVKDQHVKMLTLYGQVLDEVNSLMNLFMSFTSQRTNEVMKILTIFSVFFLPLTFISGIYGMNFQHMPELNQPWAYPAVIVLMLVVTAAIYLWFKRKKWL